MPLSEIRDFIVHLRLRFQLFVAPAAFLLGVIFSGEDARHGVLLQFFNVHILYLGGATAFNSYYDKDQGPIEGVKHPPRMTKWMLYASCILLVVGVLIALPVGPLLGLIYAVSALGFSFGYSHPAFRWKGRPVLSLFVIGLFGSVAPFWMGFVANAGESLAGCGWLALVGVTLMVVAMFPVAQAHQIGEDRLRGDMTFSARFGLPGIRLLFATLYPSALALIAAALLCVSPLWGSIAAVMGLVPGISTWKLLRVTCGLPEDYDALMKVKFFSGLSLNAFLVFLLVLGLVG